MADDIEDGAPNLDGGDDAAGYRAVYELKDYSGILERLNGVLGDALETRGLLLYWADVHIWGGPEKLLSIRPKSDFPYCPEPAP